MMALTRRQWLLMGVLTLLWGLNWPMMKFTLREVSPLYFRALTMSGGTLTLIAIFAWRGVPLGVSRANAATAGLAGAAQHHRLAPVFDHRPVAAALRAAPRSWPSRCRSGPCC